jgi:hypothetical protein
VLVGRSRSPPAAGPPDRPFPMAASIHNPAAPAGPLAAEGRAGIGRRPTGLGPAVDGPSRPPARNPQSFPLEKVCENFVEWRTLPTARQAGR